MIETLTLILGGIVAAVIAFIAGRGKGKKEGEADVYDAMRKDAQRRTQAGRDAVRDGRASGGSNDDRVRKAADRW